MLYHSYSEFSYVQSTDHNMQLIKYNKIFHGILLSVFIGKYIELHICTCIILVVRLPVRSSQVSTKPALFVSALRLYLRYALALRVFWHCHRSLSVYRMMKTRVKAKQAAMITRLVLT